jgi:DNA helicase-2/ATP-dependent DNA helicase PcrA
MVPAAETVAATRPRPREPIAPGERSFHDGDRVRHPAFGVGVVVTSKMTRADEEVTVAFRDRGVKTLLASIAGLEHVG